MPITTLSSRDLNMDIGRAKRASKEGPVIITDRGKPAHVLLSFDEYQRIIGKQESVVDMLGLPAGIEDIEVNFICSRETPPAVDLS